METKIKHQNLNGKKNVLRNNNSACSATTGLINIIIMITQSDRTWEHRSIDNNNKVSLVVVFFVYVTKALEPSHSQL